MSNSMTLNTALRQIAEGVPPRLLLPRLNRVPWLMVTHERGFSTLTLQVVDDPAEPLGAPLRVAHSESQQWWAAAQRVEKIEDAPVVVGHLYEQITAKLLGLATIIVADAKPQNS